MHLLLAPIAAVLGARCNGSVSVAQPPPPARLDGSANPPNSGRRTLPPWSAGACPHFGQGSLLPSPRQASHGCGNAAATTAASRLLESGGKPPHSKVLLPCDCFIVSLAVLWNQCHIQLNRPVSQHPPPIPNPRRRVLPCT